MAGKTGQFDVGEIMVNNKFKPFGIDLNAQHVNGMTLIQVQVLQVFCPTSPIDL